MRTKIIALMVIMAAQAHAQTLLSYTNVRADVSGGPAFSSSAVAGSFRFTYVVEDTPGVPLNLDDGTTFRLEAWAADGVRAHNVASTNLVSTDLSSGQVRFVVPSIGVGEYRIRGVAQPAGGDTTLVWQITHHMLTVTSAPSAGASVNVSVTTTANILVASSGAGNVVTGITANGSTVTEHRGTVAGGGGDAPVINGERPTNLTFNASYPFTVSTTTNASGMTITYGLSGNAGTVVIPAGNTSTSFIYYVDTNAQYYTAGPTATQLLFFAVGSAAGNSAGGLAFRYVACTGSQVFACYIPQGGLSVSNATAQGGWGYVKGGSATSTNGNYATSGGGSLAVLTDTNVVIHLGGAGGTASTASRVNGGGVNGYSYGTTASGGGATATNHGAAATAAAGATAGSSTSGGNGTATGGAYPGGGGGGGPFAGGGGCGTVFSTGGPGGAGSTDVWDGYTARSAPDSASPPSTDHVLYKTPYGVGLTTITNNARANSGFLAIVSYPSP